MNVVKSGIYYENSSIMVSDRAIIRLNGLEMIVSYDKDMLKWNIGSDNIVFDNKKNVWHLKDAEVISYGTHNMSYPEPNLEDKFGDIVNVNDTVIYDNDIMIFVYKVRVMAYVLETGRGIIGSKANTVFAHDIDVDKLAVLRHKNSGI